MRSCSHRKSKSAATIITGDSDCGAKLWVLLSPDFLEYSYGHALGEELAHRRSGLDPLMLALIADKQETAYAERKLSGSTSGSRIRLVPAEEISHWDSRLYQTRPAD